MENEDIKLKKVLQDMSYSLKHIEDIMADDRALLVKLVKQNNTIVDWLKQIQIEDVTADYEYEDILQPPLSEERKEKAEGLQWLAQKVSQKSLNRQRLRTRRYMRG